MNPVEGIIARLTEGQRRVILSLPADGEFGRAADSRCARRMFWSSGRASHLIQHRHMADNSWRLTPVGLAVKAALEDPSHAD